MHFKNDSSTAAPAAQFLRNVFLERKGRNPRYSTRAFARDLAMSQALVSLLFHGKRPLTPKRAGKISAALGLSEEDSQRLLAPQPATKFHDEDLEKFRVISQWYHLPLLDLSTTKGFQADPAWIARRLRISPVEARDALERLLKLGLLERSGSTLRKSKSKIYFRTRQPESAIRNFHKQMIEKAKEELDKSDAESFSKRHISGLTLTASKVDLPKIDVIIERFKDELARVATEKTGEDVYQLNIQFFPVSHQEKFP